MVTSKKGLDLIKRFEGCRLVAYDDQQPKVVLTKSTPIKGVLTIGYGHTGTILGKPIYAGQKITQSHAEKIFKTDLKKFEEKVMKYYTKYKWNQNEFDALVSFALNLGSIDKLTANGRRTKAEIADAMLLYCNDDGKFVQGLYNRRLLEQKLFLTKVS